MLSAQKCGVEGWLKNDLRRPSMEEIGSRATIFELEGLGTEKRKYIKWLVQSMVPKTKMECIITEDAFATLSEKLSTPLQLEFYLTRALEEACKVGQKPVGADMIDNVLAKDINGLEPRLTREGYNVKVLAVRRVFPSTASNPFDATATFARAPALTYRPSLFVSPSSTLDP